MCNPALPACLPATGILPFPCRSAHIEGKWVKLCRHWQDETRDRRFGCKLKLITGIGWAGEGYSCLVFMCGDWAGGTRISQTCRWVWLLGWVFRGTHHLHTVFGWSFKLQPFGLSHHIHVHTYTHLHITRSKTGIRLWCNLLSDMCRSRKCSGAWVCGFVVAAGLTLNLTLTLTPRGRHSFWSF